MLKPLPAHTVKSITFDNDLAFAAHEKVIDELKLSTYFCDPYKSYQKGAVEQSNLYIREAFPRDREEASITNDALSSWLVKMNQRPMKCLNWISAQSAFKQQLRKAV